MNNLQLSRYTHLGLSIILGLLLSLIAISTIHAQKPGDLDPTFGVEGTGIVTTTLGGDWQSGFGIALQSDDKIVVVGKYGVNQSSIDFLVLRYTVTGTLDSTFNITNSGFITTPIDDYNIAYDAVIQPDDGKIVAVGYSGIVYDPSPYDHYYDHSFAVARYTPTGTLDSTFNYTGIVTTPIGNENALSGNDDMAVAVALQEPRGEIVVAGRTGIYAQDDSFDVAVVRYTVTGTLDSTFNGTGIVTTPIGNGDDGGGAVAIQPDGKILVAGYSENNAGYQDFAVVRYAPMGTLDFTFGQNGIVTTPVSSGYDVASGIAIQPDGKIVVSGYSDGWNGYFAAARYTITGTLDSTFGPNHTGIVTTSIGPQQAGYRMALQPDGRILVAGFSGDESDDSYFTVIRYTTSGALDTTFNNTGIVTTPMGSGHDEGIAVAIQSDGRIVAVGVDGEGTNQDDYESNVAVIRYLNHWHSTVFVPVILKD